MNSLSRRRTAFQSTDLYLPLCSVHETMFRSGARWLLKFKYFLKSIWKTFFKEKFQNLFFKGLLFGVTIPIPELLLCCSFGVFWLVRIEHLFFIYFSVRYYSIATTADYLKVHVIDIIKMYVTYSLLTLHGLISIHSVCIGCSPKCVFSSNAGLSNVLISPYF